MSINDTQPEPPAYVFVEPNGRAIVMAPQPADDAAAIRDGIGRAESWGVKRQRFTAAKKGKSGDATSVHVPYMIYRIPAALSHAVDRTGKVPKPYYADPTYILIDDFVSVHPPEPDCKLVYKEGIKEQCDWIDDDDDDDDDADGSHPYDPYYPNRWDLQKHWECRKCGARRFREVVGLNPGVVPVR